ncbi:alpha/beta hydrolase [Methanoregula sp.]|jgi:dienelactone hydrolase|uniref:alpha/beta hydrolase n=1 Tax=Methanoregula sp. TaxID=2052170 RepID=UPI003C1DAE66
MRAFIVAAVIACLVVLAFCAGCSSTTAPSYSVDNNGILSVTCAPVTTNETVLFSNDTYTESKIILHTQSGDVVTYLSYPKLPKAVLLYLPGAGEKITGHEERMVQYAADGYAFMFLDYRGRYGGETNGYPLNPNTDFALFENKEWPEYYLTICDISSARAILASRFGVPVYAVGGSNGGRYAAVAAGVDKNFAGYIGISTADWGIKEQALAQGGSGDIIRFATSLEPSTYLPTISPRPVWMFHNATDPIIPFADGQALFATANEPKNFTVFNGGHGIDQDVDNLLMARLAQIYGTPT